MALSNAVWTEWPRYRGHPVELNDVQALLFLVELGLSDRLFREVRRHDVIAHE